ncbi:hypothetical protein MMC10_003085 [Thelotrema lepadinum]|nr:hypothetical protein [Thelotrema lepadinum]
MVAQAYERVPSSEADDPQSPQDGEPQTPNSPPPPFRSRASSIASRRHPSQHSSGPVDRTLEDTFDAGPNADGEDDSVEDDRQRLMRDAATFSAQDTGSRPGFARALTTLPSIFSSNRSRGAASAAASNDGVFANLNAKPERGEKMEEQPPSYEQAAADATPPYWETTIMAPGMASDEVYIDGLPVGSFFSFVWNGIISMAFQLVGFLLTYLLHTTHAARNGSRAGLGVTLINYGFTMRSMSVKNHAGAQQQYSQPVDPNSHDFDPANAEATVVVMDDQTSGGNFAGEWLAYVLMIVGWIVLIKAVTDFIKARRHEQLILQSPERGLNVPVVAEGENSETVV